MCKYIEPQFVYVCVAGSLGHIFSVGVEWKGEGGVFCSVLSMTDFLSKNNKLKLG